MSVLTQVNLWPPSIINPTWFNIMVNRAFKWENRNWGRVDVFWFYCHLLCSGTLKYMKPYLPIYFINHLFCFRELSLNFFKYPMHECYSKYEVYIVLDAFSTTDQFLDIFWSFSNKDFSASQKGGTFFLTFITTSLKFEYCKLWILSYQGSSNIYWIEYICT